VGTGLAVLGCPLACAVLAVSPAGAQTRASLDAGVSRVAYEGFLPSAALSLSPALAITAERFGLAARASWLRFESGNNSLRGLLVGSYSIPVSAGTGADFSAELGGSRYEQFTTFSHILGRARLHLVGTSGRSGSLAATLGSILSEGEQRSVAALSGALRFDRPNVSVALAGTGTVVGSVAYTDWETTVRHGRPGGFEAEAVLSFRAGDRGGEVGPFFEAALAAPITRYAGVVLAGGRYAEDVVRGNVAGNYLTAAIRLSHPVRRPRMVVPPVPGLAPSSDGATVAAALVEVRRGRGDKCTLVFRADSALEIMADFTDWLPAPLQPAGRGRWTLTLPIPPGRHRLNVRLSGGVWGVPSGTTPMADDFLGVVGTVVIP